MTEEYGVDRDNKGKFQPGNKAASSRGPNKVSSKVRDSIVQFLEDNIDAIQESFDHLKPKEKLEFISSIISYAVPKMSAVQTEITGDINHKVEKITVEIIKSHGSLESNTGVQ